MTTKQKLIVIETKLNYLEKTIYALIVITLANLGIEGVQAVVI